MSRWRLVGFFLVGVLVLATAVLFLSGSWAKPSTLDVLGDAPEFSLIDQDDRETTLAMYQGKMLLVNFIYTSCLDACPLMTAQLAGFQEQLAGNKKLAQQVELLTISVDPEFDTPERLKEFATRHGADLRTWRFVTGPYEHVRTVVLDGFRVPMPEGTGYSAEGYNHSLMFHTTRIVLVDKTGQIRAYYRSDDWEPEQLLRDLQKLAG